MSSLHERAKRVLKGLHYVDEYCPLNDLVEEIDTNSKLAKRKVAVYKWTAFVILLAAPILSAFVSVLLTSWRSEVVADVDHWYDHWAPWVSIALTMVTIINSAMRPGERFAAACRLKIRIDNIGDELLEELTKIHRGAVTPDALMSITEKYRRELAPIQEALIYLFLPRVIVSDGSGTRRRTLHPRSST